MTVQVNDRDFFRPAAEHDQHHVNNFYSHQVYLTEHDGKPHFEVLWDALTRKPEDRAIGMTVTGGVATCDNLPPGWITQTLYVNELDLHEGDAAFLSRFSQEDTETTVIPITGKWNQDAAFHLLTDKELLALGMLHTEGKENDTTDHTSTA